MYIKHREAEPRLPLGRDGGSTGGHTGLPKPPVSLGVESWFQEWANGLPIPNCPLSNQDGDWLGLCDFNSNHWTTSFGDIEPRHRFEL